VSALFGVTTHRHPGHHEIISQRGALQNVSAAPPSPTDEFGHIRLGGIGPVLAHEIERRTGVETRVVVLGHLQRGGSPTAFDRVLATRYGLGAIDLVHQHQFGRMIALRGNEIASASMAQALESTRKVDQSLIRAALSLQEGIGA